ncbi:MAG: serine/threonine protein kinase [Planctomycetaceae bacterium]|jgi:serine/threonine-protein kinase|nr:serine/threonine protein kinase [Planctomycetaceae bacterium]
MSSSPYDFLQNPLKESRDLTNTEFGDYHIIRRIGSGAMADVYLAEQRSLGRRVAIKILKQELNSDETYVKRFLREAKAAARLVHSNIVHVYEVGERGSVRYIVQEYVQGNNLAQYLQHHGAMTPKQVFRVIWQVASALDAASQAGIVHRDIKPENILLGEKLEIKVADFGLARVEDLSDPDLQLTKIGVTLGTPLYMSPEQSEGKPLDHRSDIYSLGITSYHMLAGRPPFRGDTALSVAIQHLKTEAETLETIRPDIPPALARIVHRMMAKSPNDRFQSVRQLKLELKQLHAKFFRDAEVSETLADWEALPLDVVDSSLNTLTDKLQTTMVFETKLLMKRRRCWSVLVACLLIFIVGAVFGRQDNTEKILRLDKDEKMIPKQGSVYEQWILAARLQTPQAWQSVIEDWDNKNMSLMAKQQLAWYYYWNRMPEQAEPYFSELAELSPTSNPDLAPFGRAGLAWVYKMQGRTEESNQLIRQLTIDYNSPPGSFNMTDSILRFLRQ